MGFPVEEVVPDAAMVKGVSRSSLLTGRRRVRLQPQTGTSAGPNSIIQFVLADSSSLCDLNSAVLSYTITTTGTGDVSLDDGPAWCRRATIALNGTNIDDTDLANRWANAQVYAGADRSTYQGPLSFAGFWAQNPNMPSGTTYPPPAYAVGDLSGSLVASSVRYKAGAQYAVPLSLISKFFGTKAYLPLSQAGELVVQLLCATNAEAIIQRSGATDGAYTITNCFLEIDMVQPHFLYAEMLNRVTQLEGEQGVVIPYNAVISAQGQSVTSSGQANIVTSLATNNLRKVIITMSPTGNLADINYPSVSAFGNHSLTGLQFRCGSLYFPSQEAVNTGSIWWTTASAFAGGEPLNNRNGIIDYQTFTKTTGPQPLGFNVTGVTQKQYFADSCVIGYGFDNYKGGEPLDADGISVLGQAGSQLVSLIRIAPNLTYFTSGVTPNIHLERTRYLVLKNGALRVEGV
jgi:hypothetical protein